MQRLLLASAALVALGSACALAADLGVQPVYKAPTAPAPLVYDWRGFYVGGRVGYASGNWLFYGTGGYAWSRETGTRTQVAGTVNAATPGTVESSSTTVGGWTAGAGIEWGVTPNLSVKAEYLHYDFQNARFVFPLANRRWEDSVTKDTVKLGVNWRLNWGPDSGVR